MESQRWPGRIPTQGDKPGSLKLKLMGVREKLCFAHGFLRTQHASKSGHLGDLVLLKPAVIRCKNIGLTMVRLSGLAEADGLPPAKRMAVTPAPVCQDDMIEALATDRAEKLPAIPEHAQSTVTMALLLLLEEDQDLVDVGISIQNMHVVTAGKDRDPGLGIFCAKTMQQGRRADQIADIIAPDHQDLQGSAHVVKGEGRDRWVEDRHLRRNKAKALALRHPEFFLEQGLQPLHGCLEFFVRSGTLDAGR